MRKLPKTGDTVAYTRTWLANAGSARANWRGVIIGPCSYATLGWPMVTVEWKSGTNIPPTSDIHLGNLCTTRSIAFVEM